MITSGGRAEARPESRLPVCSPHTPNYTKCSPKTQAPVLGCEGLKLSWEDMVCTPEYGFGLTEKNFSGPKVAW